MSQASFLAHLSRHDQAGYYSASTSNLNQMKQERSPSIITSNSNQMKQERSWGRKPLALFRRRLNSDSRPALPPPAFALDVFDKSQPIFNVAEIKSQANNIQSDPHTTDLAPRITCFYNKPVELIRKEEYPHMNQGTYLDHSGTTIYARTLITRFSTLLLTNLYGNPHSANAPADLSGAMVDAVRLETLRFLGADPAHYDLVFTANATAAIKMVGDAFRDLAEQTRTGRFWYGYHRDAHTSLVGVRELTGGEHRVFGADAEVEGWLNGDGLGAGGMRGGGGEARTSRLGLFAYPGQSNLTGRRLPLEWAGRLRSSRDPLLRDTYTLLDAAALAMTSPMGRVFADPETAPDFVCVSFYKIFGFPDLGGLVVRKESGHILALRKYFGGGTVEMVSTIGKAWHLSKGLQNAAANRGDGKGHGGGSLHEGLEDGTLPFHSILALGEAINVHAELYGSMENISAHTNMLVRRLYNGMRQLRYGDGRPLCKVYEEEEDGRGTAFGDSKRQGATVAFNVYRPDGGFEPYATVEKLANESGFYVRSGGICCPGGLFAALQYEPWQLHRARSAGHHCGSDGLGLINETPTGVVRASLGAMSTPQDVDTFLSFLHKAFVAAADSAYGGSIYNGSRASDKLENAGNASFEQLQCSSGGAPCCSGREFMNEGRGCGGLGL